MELAPSSSQSESLCVCVRVERNCVRVSLVFPVLPPPSLARWVVLASGQVLIRCTASGELLQRFRVHAHFAIRVFPSGDSFVTGVSHFQVDRAVLWGIAEESPRGFYMPTNGPVRFLEISPCGEKVVGCVWGSSKGGDQVPRLRRRRNVRTSADRSVRGAISSGPLGDRTNATEVRRGLKSAPEVPEWAPQQIRPQSSDSEDSRCRKRLLMRRRRISRFRADPAQPLGPICIGPRAPAPPRQKAPQAPILVQFPDV